MSTKKHFFELTEVFQKFFNTIQSIDIELRLIGEDDFGRLQAMDVQRSLSIL